MATTTPMSSRRQVRAELAEYARTHDPEIRNRLVHQYSGLANAMAARFGKRAESVDDLQQEATIGLLKALDRFDPDRKVEFTTYAWATISGELKRYLRDRCWRVRVPRSVQDTYLRAMSTVDDLRMELGREPTTSEVADRCDVDEDKLEEAIRADSAQLPTSLDAHHEGRGGDVGAADPTLQRVADHQVVTELLGQLAPREQRILTLHFFDGLSQTEIGTQLGISQVHVSRLIKRSLRQLRDVAGSPA